MSNDGLNHCNIEKIFRKLLLENWKLEREVFCGDVAFLEGADESKI